MSKKRKHVAIVTGQVPGHIYPMLGLCSELTSRGFRVTYPTVDSFSEKIKQNEAEPIVFLKPSLANAEKISHLPIENDLRSWQLYASLQSSLLLCTAAAIVEETKQFYRDNPPDLVIYDWLACAGKILARMFSCPAIRVDAHFAKNSRFIIRERGIYQNPAPMLGYAHLLDSFLAAYGIDQTGNLWRTEDLNIIFVPGEFQFDRDSFDNRFQFVGPSLNRHSRSAWTYSRCDKKLLLISESTLATGNSSFLRLCADAFSDSDYHVVFSSSFKTNTIDSNLIPKNFEVNTNVYNLEILPHASAVVCNSGMGTVLEALNSGVPILAVPNHAFNSEVAHRVDELGLGIHVRSADLSPTTLRAGVDLIVSDVAMNDRVKAMQKIVRSSGGASRAAELIESVIRMRY